MKSSPLIRACLLALVAGGCGTQSSIPRTRNDVFRDRLQVETLFLTADGRRFVAPMSPERAIVAEGGSLAWPAWQCNNPDCPGRQPDGSPLVFPWPDPFQSVGPDGRIVVRQPLNDEDEKLFQKFSEQNCPACLPRRKPAEESKALRQQYKDWCQPHVLPAAAKRLAELDRELEAMLSRERQPAGD